ncbi:hypothetical protein GCM10027290_48820 [Micromonospora sonneratiae]
MARANRRSDQAQVALVAGAAGAFSTTKGNMPNPNPLRLGTATVGDESATDEAAPAGCVRSTGCCTGHHLAPLGPVATNRYGTNQPVSRPWSPPVTRTIVAGQRDNVRIFHVFPSPAARNYESSGACPCLHRANTA